MKRYPRWQVRPEAFFASLAQHLGKGNPRDLCVRTNVFFPGAIIKMFGVVNKTEKVSNLAAIVAHSSSWTCDL